MRSARRRRTSTCPPILPAATLAPGQRIRLGGLVEKGTIVRGQGTEVAFSVTDTQNSVKVTYVGILPDLFREEQGVITEGSFGPDGVFVADSVLAKHDETYMPKEVADSLKAKGVWQERRNEPGSAWSSRWLRSGISRWFSPSRWRWCSRSCRWSARGRGDERMMAVGGPVAVTGFALTALAFAALTICLRAVRFLGRECLGEFAFAEADALQDHRHLGEPRGLDAALGADPHLLRRAGRGLRQQSAGDAARQCAAVQGWIGAAFLLFILATSNPFARLIAGADRGPRSQPDPAGHRPRGASAAALPRLCRLLGLLLLRRRRADRRPHRRGLGALGAAVDAGRLDRS